jgi:putative ABC transport system permease protein
VIPRLFRIWRLRLRSLVRKDAVDTELHRELAFHFDELVAEKIEEGLSPEAARQAAHRALGNVAALEESCRDERRVTWLHDLRQDVVYGIRILRKNPGFTTIAAASLALGIGANTAVLGAFDALILQQLPVAHADRLVAIQSVPLENPSQLGGNALADYAAFRDRSRAFDRIDASIRWTNDFSSDGPGAKPERITGQLVTAGWLSTFGIEPQLGRVFTEAESRQSPAIVISHGLWQRRFGADPSILNTQVRVQGGARTIIGVMPAAFRYQDPGVDYWMPLYVGPQPEAGGRLFSIRARLKPGVSLAQAQADLDAITAQLAADKPVQNKGWGVRVRPLNEVLFGWTREPLLTLEAVVALVLLIGCANVAALLLSRASVRQREVALRVALGAGRGRIIRQLLTESVLLAICGGALGLVVAMLGQRALLMMTTPPSSPPLPIALNLRVVGLLALITICTGLACGIVPALRGADLTRRRANLQVCRSGRPKGLPYVHLAGSTRRRAFPQGVLVSVQLALALVLLIGSGLLLNSLLRQVRRDLGFEPTGLVRADFSVPAGQYTRRIGSYRGFPYFEISPPPSETLERVLERLRAVPGAGSVAAISAPPVDSFILATVDVRLEASNVPADDAASVGTMPSATYFLVTPNLFATLRTPIVHGRDFTDGDTSTSPWVAIVNETCARRLWPGEDPIGKRFTLDTVPEEQAREVVGVVRDIPTRHAEDPQPVIYASYLQQPARYRAPWVGLFGQMLFMIRPAGDSAGIVPAVRRALSGLQPDRPLVSVTTMESHTRAAMGRFRSYVWLVSVFAITATLLAAIGTYGVMAYTVSQRTREIGIRRALGAGRRDIIALIGRRALAFLGVGLVVGLASAFALTRLIESQLWGVTATDPLTFVAVSLLLVAIGLAACVVPVRRALSVEPTIALRND